ncbi:MAG TPA: PAS domain-containing protein [Rhizomicrobium sp.]
MPKAIRHYLETGVIPPLVNDYGRVDAPRHRDAKTFLDYWQSCVDKSGGFVVGRDIPNRAIARLLRSIIVTEPVDGGADFHMRLAGSGVRRRFGDEIRGQMLSDLHSPEDFRQHLASSNEVLATGKPLIVDSRLKRGAIEELHAEVVLLPVKSPDGKHDWVLVGMFYFV